jgi:hypothetical protein
MRLQLKQKIKLTIKIMLGVMLITLTLLVGLVLLIQYEEEGDECLRWNRAFIEATEGGTDKRG